jgi:drug/metabolite transporter (DMT)-like permease
MSKVLLALHALLVAGAFIPVFNNGASCCDGDNPRSAVQEAWRVAHQWPASKMIVAAGLPGFLALLNLPLLGRRRPRWNAISGVMIGLVSSGLMAQLMARFGEARLWGSWVVWGLSMALLVAGTAAWARLGGRPCERCGHAC